MRLSTPEPRPVLRLLLGLVVLLAGCTGDAEVQAVERVPVAQPSPTPRPTPTPTPTPHPVPAVADVVAAAAPTRAEFVASVDGSGIALSLSGAYDTELDAIELAFDFEEFVALAMVVDPGLVDEFGHADAALAGHWVVRRVAAVVYVQQPFLVGQAGGVAGDWAVINDPAILRLLTTGGWLVGGFTQQALHDLARSAGGQAMPYNDDGQLDAYDFRVDGAKARIGSRDAAESAAFVGIPRLHRVSARVFAGLDELGRLGQATVYVPQGGFGTGSVFTSIEVEYLSSGDLGQLDLGPPTNVADGS